MILDNSANAELLASEAEKETAHVAKAFRPASLFAFGWPREAVEIVEQGESPLEKLLACARGLRERY